MKDYLNTDQAAHEFCFPTAEAFRKWCYRWGVPLEARGHKVIVLRVSIQEGMKRAKAWKAARRLARHRRNWTVAS